MRTVRYVIILFLLMLSGGVLQGISAQENKLTGRVVDARSSNSLNGADVYLAQSKEGTTTDDDGLFILEYGGDLEGDTLVISFVGYKEYRMPAWQFQDRSTIKMQAQNIQLQDSVLVRAERLDLVKQEIPHAQTTINFETIELRGSSEMSDILKGISSVRIEGNELTGRRINIRGSNADEVNVYVDGILINNLGLDNSADLSVIPIDNVEKIEVLKGSNLALLGSGAFGGVVNVTSRKSLEKEFQLKTKQGSFETQTYIGEINYPLSRRFVVNYFGQLSSRKPGIEFFPGTFLDPEKPENDQIEITNQYHNLKTNYYLDNGEISAKVYGYIMDYEKPFLKNERENLLASASYKGNLVGLKHIDFNVNYLRGNDDITRSQLNGGDSFITTFQSNILNMKFLKKITFSDKRNEFQLVAEYFHDELEDNRVNRTPTRDIQRYNAVLYENRFSLAGVIALRNQFNGRDDITWKTHLGLRDDYVVTGDHYIAPTAGAQVEFKKSEYTFAPYGSYGKNFKIHTLRDNALALPPDSTLERFDPEESSSGELGFDLNYLPLSSPYQALTWKFALFTSTVVNKLVRDPGDPFTLISTIGRNTTKGIETSVGFNKLYDHFNVLASVTFLDISRPLLYPFKPETAWSLQADYLSLAGFYITTTYFFKGKSVGIRLSDEARGQINQDGDAPLTENDIIQEEIDAFHDMDVSIGYRFRVGGAKLNLQAAGYNIFDSSKYTNFLLNKQNFQVSLSVRF